MEKMQRDHKRDNKRQDKILYIISCYVMMVKVVGDYESPIHIPSALL